MPQPASSQVVRRGHPTHAPVDASLRRGAPVAQLAVPLVVDADCCPPANDQYQTASFIPLGLYHGVAGRGSAQSDRDYESLLCLVDVSTPNKRAYRESPPRPLTSPRGPYIGAPGA